jgi:hypothetical protein
MDWPGREEQVVAEVTEGPVGRREEVVNTIVCIVKARQGGRRRWSEGATRGRAVKTP